jgi:hypothetical protein
MKLKHLAVLAAAAVALLVIVKMSGKDDAASRISEIAPTSKTRLFFKGLDPARIAEISVTSGDMKPVVLHRISETSWTIETKRGQRPVKESRAKTLLASSTGTPEFRADIVATMQAERAESQSSFKTDDVAGRLLTLKDKDGAVLESLILGKAPYNPLDSCYVRPKGEAETYLLPVNIADNFKGSKPSEYIETRLMLGKRALDVSDIRVDVAEAGKSYQLIRTSTDTSDLKWDVVIDGNRYEADTSTAETIASQFVQLAPHIQADDLEEEPDFSAGPYATITATVAGFSQPVVVEFFGTMSSSPRSRMTTMSTLDDPFGCDLWFAFIKEPAAFLPFDPDRMTGGPDVIIPAPTPKPETPAPGLELPPDSTPPTPPTPQPQMETPAPGLQLPPGSTPPPPYNNP